MKAGASHREAGERFGVSAASVSRWRDRERQQGDARPKALGGDRKSGRIEAHKETILAMVKATPDLAIEELRQRLAEKAWCLARDDPPFLRAARHHAQKKTAHASEQERPDVVKRRQDWVEGQPALDPGRLVFIDETWASTNMARRYGRCPRGERLRAGIPHGHWKTTTFVAGLTTRGIIAPWVLDGPINREAFETYVEKVLVPELRPGDIVIMDNLSSHKGPRVHQMIEAAGASLLYLPPYSPDFNPIENAFAKLKALLRKAAERTVDGLWNAIGRIIDCFTQTECKNYFSAAGYGAT